MPQESLERLRIFAILLRTISRAALPLLASQHEHCRTEICGGVDLCDGGIVFLRRKIAGRRKLTARTSVSLDCSFNVVHRPFPFYSRVRHHDWVNGEHALAR